MLLSGVVVDLQVRSHRYFSSLAEGYNINTRLGSFHIHTRQTAGPYVGPHHQFFDPVGYSPSLQVLKILLHLVAILVIRPVILNHCFEPS